MPSKPFSVYLPYLFRAMLALGLIINTSPLAQAQATTYLLTVNKAGTGAGTVTSSPAGIDCGSDCDELYASDTLVTLTATPAADSMFAGWSGACSGAGSCTVTMDAAGVISVDVEVPPPLTFVDGRLLDEAGLVLAVFDGSWKHNRGRLTASLGKDGAVTLAVSCIPLDSARLLTVSPTVYATQRATCAATWKELIGRDLQIEAPEPLVNYAWRNALCQNFQLINHGQLRYSTGNQYDRIYSAEGSDSAMALLVWGYEPEVRRLLGPLFDFTRKCLELHPTISTCRMSIFSPSFSKIIKNSCRRWNPTRCKRDNRLPIS